MNRTKGVLYGLVFGAMSVATLLSPVIVSAQETAKPDDPLAKYAEKRVNLDVDSKRLPAALKALMTSVGADYILDAPLRDAIVTVHLSNATLDKALKTLMKVSSVPFDYEMEDDVFHFVVRTKPLPEEKPPAEPKPPVTERIPLENNTAGKIFELLTKEASDKPVNAMIVAPNDGTRGGTSGRNNYNGFGFNNGNLTWTNLNRLFGLNAQSQTGRPNGQVSNGIYFGPGGLIFFNPPLIRNQSQNATVYPRR